MYIHYLFFLLNNFWWLEVDYEGFFQFVELPKNISDVSKSIVKWCIHYFSINISWYESLFFILKYIFRFIFLPWQMKFFTATWNLNLRSPFSDLISSVTWNTVCTYMHTLYSQPVHAPKYSTVTCHKSHILLLIYCFFFTIINVFKKLRSPLNIRLWYKIYKFYS